MILYEVRISAVDLSQVEVALLEEPEIESAAFLLAGELRLPDRHVLIVRRVVEIPAAEYRIRDRHQIELSPRAINGLIALCEKNKLRAILCHSHPDESPYSPSDDFGEARIASTLWDFLPQQIVGSLLLTPSGFRGRVWLPGPRHEPITAMRVIGRSIRSLPINGQQTVPETIAQAKIHDRQILAFGRPGQALIEAAKVGVVGAGGTGSPVAEQLVRLGVRDLILVDRDPVFDPSNLSRVYGSHSEDANPPFWRRWFRRPTKLNIVARHLRRISPKLRVQAIHGDVTNKSVAHALLDRDLIFTCTDNHHWGRAVLNQIAYQYLIPVINVGVALDGEEGTIRGGLGMVQVLRPGLGCLWCAGYLDSTRIRDEALPVDERRRLEAEGYARGVDGNAPSVVTLTTTIAGMAGTQFLQLVTDFMGEAGEVSRLNHFVLEGVIARGTVAPRPDCLCSKVKGRGDLTSLPVVG